MNSYKGILLVDKSAGWSSFDVVNKVRSLLSLSLRQKTGERHKVKVGHSGTLDPFATGLMILAIGETTKQLDKFMKLDKSYTATLMLDAFSDTGDKTGQITELNTK